MPAELDDTAPAASLPPEPAAAPADPPQAEVAEVAEAAPAIDTPADEPGPGELIAPSGETAPEAPEASESGPDAAIAAVPVEPEAGEPAAAMPEPIPQTASAALPDGAFQFEGHVDFFGYHPLAGCWLFGGWMTHPWPAGSRPEATVARFANAVVDEQIAATFYFREDVAQRGIGYVFFLRAPDDGGGEFLELDIRFTHGSHRVMPSRTALRLDGAALLAEVEPILAAGEEGSQRRKLLEMLRHGKPIDALTGIIDFYGYHAAAGVWVFTGWLSAPWPPARAPGQIMVAFEQGDLSGTCRAALYPRPDADDGSVGVTFLLPGPPAALGSLTSLSFELGRVRSSLFPSVEGQRLREAELAERARGRLLLGQPGSGADRLLAVLSRKAYSGADTLKTLSDPVMFEIDELIFCEPDGLLLMGWHLAKPGVVQAIRIRCGELSVPLDLRGAFIVNRADVLSAFQDKYGFDDPRCGFVAFLPHAATRDGQIYVEIETVRGEIGHRPLPRGKLQGIAAIRHVLERVNVRFGAVPPAYDKVLGPAVEALNRTRLAQRPAVEVVEYGEPPPLPVYSVIVPLYGRIDFIEYQMALFSERRSNDEVEYIYVLDDPALQQETKFLCASVYERFGIPIRLLVLERNAGFAPASNIGLTYATGSYVVFMNSDVFPGTLDWLECLARQLQLNPDIGVIGPMLLYEDGTVQHQGMEFRLLREFGDWPFGQHIGKGMRYAGDGALRRCISITGACMMMRYPLARQIGGFDEIYAVGDFEDSDLCLRLHALGYASAVDPQVRLYHLERQSQASAAATWRLNLTIYNAWQHQRRWARTIAAYPGGVGA